jgi:hypothetical protein
LHKQRGKIDKSGKFFL